jgi:WD40 repeat protein
MFDSWPYFVGMKEIRGSDKMHALALSADGRRLLTATWDQTLRLWDLESGRQLHCFFGHTAKVNATAFSLDGRFALSGSQDRTMRLWRLPAPVLADKGR